MISDPSGHRGRSGLDNYTKLGYLAYGVGLGDAVSATLDYALGDYSISLAADFLG